MALLTGLALPVLDLIPDAGLRFGIRRLLDLRRRGLRRAGHAAGGREAYVADYVERLRHSPIAVHAGAANEQHYEVPADFFALVLGPHLKYSCAYWPPGSVTLGVAERAALEQVATRAQLADGQRILDLGCGWGAFSLWCAERYPNARIDAVSNSQAQRAFISERAAARGLENLRVFTADITRFEPPGVYDRAVSIEMFEHLRNYSRVLARIAPWLDPTTGKLFVHIFTHRTHPYLFVDEGPTDWMARRFFTGGQMPAADLLPRFGEHLTVENQWWLSGTHYARTAEAWLVNLDRRRTEVLGVLGAGADPRTAQVRYHEWRLFFLACAELFACAGGTQWGVSHYRFRPQPARRAQTRKPRAARPPEVER